MELDGITEETKGYLTVFQTSSSCQRVASVVFGGNVEYLKTCYLSRNLTRAVTDNRLFLAG